MSAVINTEIQIIIDRALEAAIAFGTGLLSSCREQIELNDFEWTEEIESYCYDRVIMISGEK